MQPEIAAHPHRGAQCEVCVASGEYRARLADKDEIIADLRLHLSSAAQRVTVTTRALQDLQGQVDALLRDAELHHTRHAAELEAVRQTQASLGEELARSRDELAAVRDELGTARQRESLLGEDLKTAERRKTLLSEELKTAERRETLLSEELRRAAADGRERAAELQKTHEQLNAVRSDFSQAAANSRRLDEEFTEALGELESQLASAREAFARQLEAADGEREELAGRFLAQTKELLAATRHETERTAHLIDIVQSSHFWRLKRRLNRLKRGFARA